MFYGLKGLHLGQAAHSAQQYQAKGSSDYGPSSKGATLFELRAEAVMNNYAVTPDGDRILAIVPGEEGQGGAATVVLNWAAGLRTGG